tara:strand:- start:5795 stop:7738 length:1944 start_codon:yes stop_codon:yes gene_type:complete
MFSSYFSSLIHTLLFLLFVFLSFSGTIFAQEAINKSNDYLVDLQQQAKQKKLSTKRPWHLLLRYRSVNMGGIMSEADGMAFFNSPQGKTDPEAELAATLASFFIPLSKLVQGKEHPQCDFAARFKWLKKELAFDSKRLKEQKCERLERWLNTLDPVGATLVFASHFMNNPASMFGHTLIRIDSRRATNNKKLLNYGANYAAIPDTDNALLYAFKGLTGMFKGQFSIFPYYTKVQEYNNWESRDLWEYELQFTEDQLNTLLLNLWELGGTYFDYYYLQENCSYHVLSLLEAANPELRMKDQLFFSVIPSDTVKILMAQKDLVKRVVYRPAVLSQMNQKRLKMSTEEKKIFQELVEGTILSDSPAFSVLPEHSSALLLNAYMDYLQYTNLQKKEENQQDKIPHPVLLARSRLHVGRKDHEWITRFSSSPDLGHGADRLRLGAGHNNKEPFLELAYRPAYHDLMAKDIGYDKDSEIIFFDIKLRYFLESERIRLDRAKILAITAINPYDPLFAKPSWRMVLEIDTLRDVDCKYCNSYKASFGSGFSYRSEYFSPLLLFSFVDVKTEFSGDLNQDYRLGGDAEIGAFYDFSENWKIKVLGSYQVFILGDSKKFFTSSFETRYSILQDLDVRLEHNRYDRKSDTIFSVNVYF